ncbi:16S rRNA (cytidine(1402)-2'-O)-methyltransferase [Synechococcus sp. L2F]|uniref:16S rRNA (cytidine(1402)-2'-O)-methyltransferase n=1 Tax=Synechococcus sp. L2F TaxID=2823739 RepID=UPI0020CC2A87|nr:16S rRNA (cytidine(1402)-2'-O)-methyltransferase [Synechococcus sp. L2F]MCP9827754.1 16S rRNA (cytidine(1402)-2'-O)-methyltransferase [Synechococcus sp. L2F]
MAAPSGDEPLPLGAPEAKATSSRGALGAEPAAGVLYLVGTPIGNLADLSPRARLVLEHVDRIACEDTRHSGQLLARLGIRRPLLSFHQHNQATRLPELLQALQRGERLAVISDAGLPGISDPGEPLVAAARQAGLEVVCIPGPCAVTTALVSSGLPSGRFCFEGFLAAKPSQRRRQLQELAAEPRTLVLFEAPHRLIALLEDLLELLGDRPLRVARELTKRHEQQVGPTVAAALEHFRRVPPLGECTLVLGGAPPAAQPAWNEAALRVELESLLVDGLSKREAARTLAERTGHSRRDLYALLHRDGPEAEQRDSASGDHEGSSNA